MNKKIIFSLALLICTFQLNSQTVQTQWIQEFESKFDDVNVLLIEDDFIFLFLEKSFDEYVIQKRRLSDNSLEKEIIFEGVEQNGKLIKEFFYEGSFKRKGSEIYFCSSYVSKKGKIGFISLFKLNKTSLNFEEFQKIEISLSERKEKISVLYSLVKVNNEEVFILSSSTYLGNNFYDFDVEFLKYNYFIVNEHSIKEIKKSEYISLENSYKDDNPRLAVVPNYTYNYSSYDKKELNSQKISCNNQEYFERDFFPNRLVKNNFYSIVNTNIIEHNNLKKEEFFLLNFNSNYDSTVSNTEIISYDDYDTLLKRKSVSDCKINTDFSFTLGKGDDLSYFNIGDNNYFIKNDNRIIKRPVPGSADSYIYETTSKDIEIVCISSGGELRWKNEIVRDEFEVNNESYLRPYYVQESKENIVIFYSNKYLVINQSSGDYHIVSEMDYQLHGDSHNVLGELRKYDDKIMVISHEGKGNKKTIKIGYLNIVSNENYLLKFIFSWMLIFPTKNKLYK